MMSGLATAIVITLLAYALFVVLLMLAGRRDLARAVAGFIPDCIVLVRRLASDPRVPRRHKLLLGALVGYLALPFDLVPDFIPVAGQLDDAVVVALALRVVLRAGGPELLREHWGGPEASLVLLLRLTGRPADR
jgi:uncharacterized membrane protein YkvA (DUF1232 family)